MWLRLAPLRVAELAEPVRDRRTFPPNSHGLMGMRDAERSAARASGQAGSLICVARICRSDSGSFVELLSALDRKRGKGGQQVVRVEHVHVHPGGQAIVGNVATGGGEGGGVTHELQGEPHAPDQLAHTPVLGTVLPPLRSADAEREAVPRSSDAERPLQNARRKQVPGPRTAEGLTRIRAARTIHGQYSAEMIELRRMIAVLRREARRTTAAVV